MRRDRPPLGLVCSGCKSPLDLLSSDTGSDLRLRCPGCGRSFTARKKAPPSRSPEPPPVGGLTLAVRGATLRVLPWVYHAGVVAVSIVMLSMGWIIPAIRRWLDDELDGLDDLVKMVGGIWIASESKNPDNDFGPRLRRIDAPGIFDEVVDIARRLGVRPPEEIRLAFLPCCGVVAWRRSTALLLGLPLLDVLSIEELRAVLAHELAHMAKGDPARSVGSIRLIEGLGRALDDPDGRVWGPLRFWSEICQSAALRLVGPIARGQEARADRASAGIAGGPVAATALMKVALVQPIFREILSQHLSEVGNEHNLYATFRLFWLKLPESLLEAMRLRLLVVREVDRDSPHPPLPDRFTMLQNFPPQPTSSTDQFSAATLIGDLEWLEQMLHDRLFGLPKIEPSIFHRAGS
ncbi:M48 family metallopeptidase [Tundrisphaera lichenicola]|uniref:M48 family metallopeptidase n=1 Tax=Tundrisphaera lichenicola TaxID=2029860 RepID=UPI003EBD1B5B